MRKNIKLIKELKEKINKSKDIPCPKIARLNILRCQFLITLVYRFNKPNYFLGYSQNSKKILNSSQPEF